MKLIIDTNILLSALIKDSKTREILLSSNWKFYYPEMSFHEIRKYKNLVLKKSGITEKGYQEILNNLLLKIIIIPDEQIFNNLNEAKKIMGKIDVDDVVFIACALSINDSIIWSDDKHFEKQDVIKTLKTNQIIDLI